MMIPTTSSASAWIRPIVLLALVLLGACGAVETNLDADRPASTYVLADGSTLSSQQAERFGTLRIEAIEAYYADDFATCAERLAAAQALYESKPDLAYDRACCLALDGRPEAALEELDRAAALGFDDVDHLKQDEDLDSLRDRQAFEQIQARMAAGSAGPEAAAVAAAGVDPAAGDFDPAPTFADLEALDSWYEDEHDTLRALLEPPDRQAVLPRLRRSHMIALRAWADDHPESAAGAAFRALEVHADLEPPSPSLETACSAYLVLHGGGPHGGAAELLLASSRLGDSFDDRTSDAYADAMAAMAETAERILEKRPKTTEAHLWILRAAMHRIDRERVAESYGRLRDELPADDPFWSENGYFLFGPRLVTEGLPPFDATSLDGREVSADALRGQVVLLDFWGTWCQPCVDEIPALTALYAEHRDRGFEIVGISADSESQIDRDRFRTWVEERGMSWPQVYDGQALDAEVVQQFGVVGFPTTVLLDRDGSIAAVNLRGDALAARVAELL